MRTLKFRFLYSIIFGVVLAVSSPAFAETVTVYPSGEEDGSIDHANIQSAMDAASPGSTVKLAAGNFYVNAGIVVEGFNGTLQGTTRGKNILTTLEAVAPFSYSHATNYFPPREGSPPWDYRVMPSMLFLEFPVAAITVKDLVFQALAPAYVEGRPGHTALDHFIADFGNDVDVTYKNLTFIADVGDYGGSNVVFAIHSMRGPACETSCDRRLNPDLHGAGNAVFSQIRSINVADYVLEPMWYRDGLLKIEDISANKGMPVAPWGMINMNIDISGIDSTNGWRALWLGFVSGGKTTVRELTVDGWLCPLIVVTRAENVDIRDSWLSGCNGYGVEWRNPILVTFNNRNITITNNAIVDVTGIKSAIYVIPNNNNDRIFIRDNAYDPSIFNGPPDPWAVVLGSDNSFVVEPSLMPHQVLDVGDNNSIKLGKH